MQLSVCAEAFYGLNLFFVALQREEQTRENWFAVDTVVTQRLLEPLRIHYDRLIAYGKKIADSQGVGKNRRAGEQRAVHVTDDDRRFQALVGVDDRAGPLGSVVFRVNIDGKDRYVSDPLSLRDTPRTIDVDVSGGKILILFTEFGERGEVRDFADWVEARLIR